MATVFIDGFENGAWSPDWTSWYVGLPAHGSAYARSGAYGVNYSQTTGAGRSFPNGLSLSECYFQFATYFKTYSYEDYSYANWQFRMGAPSASSVLSIQATVNRGVRFYLGNWGSLILTGTIVLPRETWHLIEIHYKISSTDGIVELRTNGVLNGAYYGNTVVSGLTTFNTFGLTGKSSGTTDTYVDDLVFNDPTGTINNSWTGGLNIIRLAPTGDGSSSQWSLTPPGLTHYTSVDEVPPSGTDYISTSSAGALDTFSHSSLPSTVSTANTIIVQEDVWAKKGATEDSSKVVPIIKIGPTTYQGQVPVLTTTYNLVNNIWQLNPAGTTWDITTINNLELGVLTSG